MILDIPKCFWAGLGSQVLGNSPESWWPPWSKKLFLAGSLLKMSSSLTRCIFLEQESSQPQSSSGQGGAGSFQNTAISTGGIGYSGSSGGGGCSHHRLRSWSWRWDELHQLWSNCWRRPSPAAGRGTKGEAVPNRMTLTPRKTKIRRCLAFSPLVNLRLLALFPSPFP